MAGLSEVVPAPPSTHARGVRVTLIRRFDALERLAHRWNALVERAQTKSIFQTYECHRSWWRAFGADHQLLVIVAEEGGELMGIAPLMVGERAFLGLRRRMVQFIGARSFDYTDVIVDRTRPDVLSVLLKALVEAEPACDYLYLRDIPTGSPTADALRSFFEADGRHVDVRFLYEAPARVFKDPVEDRRLANKKSLKRHCNNLRKLGEVRFFNCETGDEVLGYLDAFFEQHVRRRALTDTPSMFVDERMQHFFAELTSALAPRGWLLFSVLLLDQRPVAMHFGFEFDGRITWYKPAFDIELAKHSPGEVLIKHLIEYALERKAAELDFTIGAEPFKYRFANETRANCAVRVYRRRLPYLMDRILLNARHQVERAPRIAGFARRALGAWRSQGWF
ncbi:MAG: GNAT family N-acetyltransferase [Burkholderiales bacterium]